MLKEHLTCLWFTLIKPRSSGLLHIFLNIGKAYREKLAVDYDYHSSTSVVRAKKFAVWDDFFEQHFRDVIYMGFFLHWD